MRINNISYVEFENLPKEWRFNDFSFGEINLIVGQNASGKTRTLNVISSLARLLSKKGEINISEGNYKVEFTNDSERINYELEYKNNSVIREKLAIKDEVKDKVYLNRYSDGYGKIYFEDEKRQLKFHTPPNEIAAVARRDSVQHSFLEKTFNWADKCVKYRFGEKMGQDRLLILTENAEPFSNINIKETDKVILIFDAGVNFKGSDFNNTIIADMDSLGYKLDEIGIKTPKGIKVQSSFPADLTLIKTQALFIREKGLDGIIYQHEMSQGMFRALSLFIQLNYILLVEEPQTILIDDIGEGLDFERSSHLIKLLIEKAKNTNVQLIMTTNDQFVMNNVPIEYWFILNREGNTCFSYNYRNSKELFDEFEFTGLNNFDLFATNFYLKGK